MSRIADLIQELCPHGVPYIELQVLFNIRNGYTPSKSDTSNWTNGTVPWFRMEDIRDNGRILEDSIQRIPQSAVKGGRAFPANSILVATSATIGEHALITVPHLSNQRFTSLALKPEFADKLDMKFVFYYGFVLDEWCKNNTTVSSFASVDMAGFKKFRFPVPPLEVQREIVRILDRFTALEAELEAELEARSRQYSFYRDSLLSFDDSDCEWLTLGEVSLEFGRGKSKHRPRNDPRLYGGRYPFIQTGDIRNSGHLITQYSQTYNETGLAQSKLWPRGTICITIAANIAETGILDFDCCFPDSVIGMVVNPEKTSHHFVEYLLQSLKVNLAAKGQGSAQANISLATFENERFPFPPLEEQERIVGTLDKFDALVNDLSSGLPAELHARRKQYAYYRDRLLTFKEWKP